ncbi:MAG: hypothetical protein N3B11_04340 [Coriobacteriia bacterium]|nr:hypothetical protein [Coriobacteriia bacterium]
MVRASRLAILACIALAAAIVPAVANAFDESTTTPPPSMSSSPCDVCHRWGKPTQWPTDPACSRCHNPGAIISYDVSGVYGTGPHGGYTALSSGRKACHTLHDAASGRDLLPGQTIRDTCFTCHDGTQGQGVYGTIVARGLTVGGQHRLETTAVVPGGNASTGGSATMAFSGANGTLTCSDCHSPHGNQTVAQFSRGSAFRPRTDWFLDVRPDHWMNLSPDLLPDDVAPYTSLLLKQKPGGATTAVANYGSDWCLACHRGRASGMQGVFNHPVQSLLTTTLVYKTVWEFRLEDTNENSIFLWQYPRTGDLRREGMFPICQQCHEDTRYVGTLSADGRTRQPAPLTITAADGKSATDNPRFLNFPHETTGYRLLVEATTTAFSDDLCLNCHPEQQLP